MAERTAYFDCSRCGHHYKWKPELVGRAVQCKQCDTTFYVPSQPVSGATQEDIARSSSLVPPTMAICPACQSRAASQAIICVACGYNFITKQQLSNEAPAGSIDTDHTELAIIGIFRTPFTALFATEAVGIVIVSMGLWFGVVFLMMFLVAPSMLLGQLMPCFGYLGYVAMIALLIGFFAWLGSRYFELVEMFESTTPTVSRDSTWRDFLMLLWVSVVGWGPAMVFDGLVEAEIHMLSVPGLEYYLHGQILLLLIVWGLVYWPMGVAQAAAYDVLNPMKVCREISANWKVYAMLLVYVLPFVIAGVLLSELVPLWVEAILPEVVAGLIGWVLAVALWQYAFCSQFAMLGKLLRRNAMAMPLTREEMIPALPWILGAIVACVGLGYWMFNMP